MFYLVLLLLCLVDCLIVDLINVACLLYLLFGLIVCYVLFDCGCVVYLLVCGLY